VSPDPYGSLGESMFTLFRILTGEDWTDLRYNLMAADELGLIQSSPVKITIFHVIWYILSAFLLLNLVLGAILNNYNVIMEENRQKKKKEEMLLRKQEKNNPDNLD
jgi:voltage-gated sodium channel